MRIFITVGTTHFDSLIKYLDKYLIEDYDITFQIANGKYKPMNFPYFRFIDSIANYIDSADVVITHAGAGSIYSLLEKMKKIIVVPNIDRQDKHQLEIANFVEENDYGFYAHDYIEIIPYIENINFKEFKKYKKEDFHKASEILSFVEDSKNVSK